MSWKNLNGLIAFLIMNYAKIIVTQSIKEGKYKS